MFLLTGSPGQTEEKHVVRRSEVVARPGGRRGADEHPAVGILLEAIDRLLPLGKRVIAHQRDAAEPGLLAEFLQRSHGRLELAEQDHLVLGVELAQQVHRHANLHRFQVTPQRAESRENRSVLEAQHVVLLPFLGGEGHLQQLPLLALEAGQHILAPAQHPVTQLRPQTLAELRVAGEAVAELFQRQLSDGVA